jgi:hypothetical protein
MASRSRRTRRRKGTAAAKAKRAHGDVMRERYYLTEVKRPCRCSACGRRLREGAEFVFRKLGPVTLCVPCADRDPLVEYRTSRRWEEKRMREREARR